MLYLGRLFLCGSINAFKKCLEYVLVREKNEMILHALEKVASEKGVFGRQLWDVFCRRRVSVDICAGWDSCSSFIKCRGDGLCDHRMRNW